jgi:5'-nucleotidase
MHGSKLISDLYKHGWCSSTILSINFPDVPAQDVKGIKITKQGSRDFQMSGVEKRSYPRGGNYYWLTYGAGKSNPPEGTDLRAIYDGYISITPIHTNLTNTSEIKVLEKEFLNSQ